MKERRFVLIGINSDSLPTAKKAVRENNLNWRSFQNRPAGSSQGISDAYSIDGWPTLIVLDGDRRVRYWGHDGHAATKLAEQLVDALEKR